MSSIFVGPHCFDPRDDGAETEGSSTRNPFGCYVDCSFRTVAARPMLSEWWYPLHLCETACRGADEIDGPRWPIGAPHGNYSC